MSNRYKGGVISATPPTTTGGEDGTASGAWTLEQQAQLQAAGLWPSPPPPLYIENVFSTYLYTGTGAAQTITNGINLSGKGGLVWLKNRSGANDHGLFDTIRGAGYRIVSNLTDAENFSLNYISSFGSTGFSLGAPSSSTNASGNNYASWTFREQPKFFDVVTYTGNGTAGRQIAHNLGSVPGCIIVKRTDTAGYEWEVYHRSLGNTKALWLNSTTAAFTFAIWNDTDPTSTNFTVGGQSDINYPGGTYVAYLFAHDAGGFGLTGTDNVISCGSFTTPSSGDATITLGYEPQWLMVKSSSNSSDWYMVDNMRGFSQTSQSRLDANLATAEEVNSPPWFIPTATGFTAASGSIGPSRTFIYIAIRRGPMAVPTDSTGLYSANRYQYPTGYGGGLTITPVSGAAGGYGGFPTDLFINTIRNQSGDGNRQLFADRLRGIPALWSTQTFAEASPAPPGSDVKWDNMVGVTTASAPYYVYTPYVFTNYFLRRAPSFFDVVCYTGNGTAGQTYSHNLTVAPELMIIKSRSASGNWPVYSTATGNTNVIYLNYDTYASASNEWNNTTPTASVFTLGINSSVNNSGTTYVAYLFATCAGVSKVGSYTGTGATQTINCGFSGGARFVMIKRYDSGTTGNWWVWDTVSGMVAGTDNRIPMNTTDAEANNNWVYTASTGFEIVTTDASVNASGGTYIFLAIA